MITRRAAAQLFATTAVAAALGATGAVPAFAADKVVKVGVDLSLTGADAQGATREKDAIQMAFDAANQANAVPGYTFERADAGRRHRDRRPVRSGPGGHQRRARWCPTAAWSPRSARR